jgi:hypothetical protein
MPTGSRGQPARARKRRAPRPRDGRRPTTAAILAAVHHTGERNFYYCKKLRRSGRADLIGAVERGEMTTHAALKLLTANLQSPRDRLVAELEKATAKVERLIRKIEELPSSSTRCAAQAATKPRGRRKPQGPAAQASNHDLSETN